MLKDVYAIVGGDLYEVSSLDNHCEAVTVRCPANVTSITNCWYEEMAVMNRRDETVAVVCCTCECLRKWKCILTRRLQIDEVTTNSLSLKYDRFREIKHDKNVLGGGGGGVVSTRKEKKIVSHTDRYFSSTGGRG